MLRVGLRLCIWRASFTHSLNVVSVFLCVRPITVKQSLVYLWTQLSLSSRWFNIVDDSEANDFRRVHLITCFCIVNPCCQRGPVRSILGKCCLILLPSLWVVRSKRKTLCITLHVASMGSVFTYTEKHFSGFKNYHSSYIVTSIIVQLFVTF